MTSIRERAEAAACELADAFYTHHPVYCARIIAAHFSDYAELGAAARAASFAIECEAGLEPTGFAAKRAWQELKRDIDSALKKVAP